MRLAGTTLICTAMKPHPEGATLGSAGPHDRRACRPPPVRPPPTPLPGRALTLEAVEAVARHGAPAILAPEARRRMAQSRAVIEAIVARDETVYGGTTGFGDLATKRISPADAARLQENLLVSHAVGVGPPLALAPGGGPLPLRGH